MRSLNTKVIAILALFCCLYSCTEPSGNAEFRVCQLVVNDNPMQIKLLKKGQAVYDKELNYKTITGYEKLPGGTYTFQMIAEGKIILEKEIGLGNKGKYSLCVFGLPTALEKKNSSTWKNTLHDIAEGKEASDPNAFFPQLKILSDAFYGDKTQAKVRWFHAVPGIQKLNGEIVTTSKNDTTTLKSLDYPDKSVFLGVKPGKKEVYWTLGSKKRKVAKTTLNVQAKEIYDFFVVPRRNNFADSLEVLTARSSMDEN